MIAHAEFERHLGATLSIEFEPGHPIAAQLSGCSPLASSGGWQSFTVTFTAAGPREQQIATVALPGLEPEEIFLVPVAAAPEGLRYEAVFTAATPETEKTTEEPVQ